MPELIRRPQPVANRPREIAPGIFWIGSCTATDTFGTMIHIHNSAYVIKGEAQSLLIDCGTVSQWSEIETHLDAVLGDRPLDWIAPTHPESPHGGSVGRLCRKYPNAKVVGDVRDYHLYFPEFVDRLESRPAGSLIDLGGGYRFVFLEAIIKDVPSTQWGYEASQQVLFVADAFAFSHHMPVAGFEEYPIHLEGECALMTNELPVAPTVEQAAFITKAALFWTRYVRVEPYLDAFTALIDRYPAKLIAPAHGSVITNLDDVLPVIYEAHRMAYQGAHTQ